MEKNGKLTKNAEETVNVDTLSLEELENTEGGDVCYDGCLVACNPGGIIKIRKKEET